MEGGKLDLQNVNVTHVEVGNSRSDGQGKDINGLEAYLENYVVGYDKDGAPVKPEVTVLDNGTPLVRDRDYVVVYEDNVVSGGNEKAVIYGMDKYKGSAGSKAENFKIGIHSMKDIRQLCINLFRNLLSF